jgi:hypothetical protein
VLITQAVHDETGLRFAESAAYLGLLDADFEITDSPELEDALRKLAARYQRAVHPTLE